MLGDTRQILSADIDAIASLYAEDASPALSRALARTFSAYIEGVLYGLRQYALVAEERDPGALTHDELTILTEKVVVLDDKGMPRARDDFQRFLPMLLFTLRAFAKANRVQFEPDTSDHRWESMQKFIGFRNRLMHPKARSDLEFSQDDLDQMMKAVNWFHDMNIELAKAIKRENGTKDAQHGVEVVRSSRRSLGPP